MTREYADYNVAYREALTHARLVKHDVGIEKWHRQGGKVYFTYRLIPSPEKSFGCDAKAERVRPSDPFSA